MKPRQTILVNCCVFPPYATEPVNVIEPLRQLQARGVELLACGPCLEHFGLGCVLQVGQVGNIAARLARLSIDPGVLTLLLRAASQERYSRGG